MNRFAPEQLRRFLEVLDDHLEQAAEITLIGGSALAIGYGVGRATNDIDTYESELREVERAANDRVRFVLDPHCPAPNPKTRSKSAWLRMPNPTFE